MCRGALSGVDVTSPHVAKGASVKCERQSRQTRVPAKKQNRFTLSQVGSIASLVEDAEKIVIESQSGAADRLRDNVAKLLDAKGDLDEGRIAMDLALLAVRSDVSEEIDRMRAHVVSARQLLETGGVIGRRFDFLTQELNREANTLCSKASSSGLNAVGLELKVVVDQLREQVQNVE